MILYCVQRVATLDTSSSEEDNVPKRNIENIITSSLQSFFQLISSVLKYMFNSLLNVVFGFLLRSELFTIAAGNSFIFPITNPERSNAYHLVAEYISNKWLTLSEMEEMDEIIYNVSSTVAKIVTKLDIRKANIVELLFDRFDNVLSSKPSLHDEYEAVKKAAYTVSPTNLTVTGKTYLTFEPEVLEKEIEKRVNEWLSHPFIARCIINKIFLVNRVYQLDTLFSSNTYDRFLLVRSVLALSKQPQISKKIQQIYDSAIIESANELNANMYQWEIENILFEKLKRKFEKYGLNTELETTKKNLSEYKNFEFDLRVNFFSL